MMKKQIKYGNLAEEVMAVIVSFEKENDFFKGALTPV